jgi:excisionase family DNA binding protein
MTSTEGLLLTLPQAADMLGLTASQVRALVRKRQLAYVPIGSRKMIPREALLRFIADKVVKPCHDEIPDPASASSASAIATTSPGPSAIAAGSAARARRIADGLRSPSPSSSTYEPEGPGRVIQLKPS